MKRITISIIGILSILSFTACNDWIDESEYTYAIGTSTFYNTLDEANAAVMAPLASMRATYDANWFATLEINTEYCYPKGVYQTYKIYDGFQNTTHINRTATNWTNIFKAILYCNTAIGKLPEANAMSREQIDAYIGELRFLRGLNYFNIVRHWGGVPLRTEKNLEQWDLGKSSIDEIYDFVIEDLLFAINNCPDVPRYVGTPGKNASKAVLAEVYMYRKNYAEAKKLTEDVINSKVYSLVKVGTVRDFDKVFGADLTTSTEEVFYIKTSRTDYMTWNYLSYTSHPKYEIEPGKLMLNGNGYYTHYTDLRNKVIDEWDKNDLRHDLNVGFYVFGSDAFGDYTCLLTKYWDSSAQGDGANVSIPLVRYTDVLLTYAEATARVAGAPTQDAIDVLNQIRRRGYGVDPAVANATLDYKLSDYNTMEKFIDLLIKEERYERMNEAKHWDLIVRLGKAQELVGKYYNVEGEYTEITERHYLWNIPDSEFNYNKALDQKKDQNPGYGV